MPVKKEADGRRWVASETVVPGTPEEVWAAIATGPGLSSWFVPSKVEERAGGTINMDFGPGMESAAKITTWEPPVRLVAEDTWGPGAPTMMTEWTVEARSGGTCLVRVVHSMYTDKSDWDGQLEGTETGWPGFFRILRLCMQHFRGLPCSSVRMMAMTQQSEAEAWQALCSALGFAKSEVGATLSSRAGAPRIAGVVENASEKPMHALLMRISEPAPGIAAFGAYNCGALMVSGTVYFYGEKAAEVAKREDADWQALFAKLFPAPAGTAGA